MSRATELADRLDTSIYYADQESAALLRQQEAVIKQCIEALEPHKSVALRWYTPVDAAIAAAKEILK